MIYQSLAYLISFFNKIFIRLDDSELRANNMYVPFHLLKSTTVNWYVVVFANRFYSNFYEDPYNTIANK